jgi:hypothetical protein
MSRSCGLFCSRVGVEQIQRDVADAHLPDLDLHHPLGHLDLDVQLGAVGAQHRRDRQVVEVGVAVDGVLDALVVDGLVEIALAEQQADGDEGHAQVAGRLAVVAGEDAQPAGIDRQALVEAELEAEVGDQVVVAQVLGAVRARRLVVIGVVGRQHARVVAEEHRVVGGIQQALLVDALEEGLRAVADRAPQARVQAREERARRPVPAVPQVVGEFLQPRQARRQLGIDFELEGGAGHVRNQAIVTSFER